MGIVLAWIALGALLSRLSPWSAPLTVVLGTAVIVGDLRGLALVLASVGALTMLALGVRALGPRLPWLAALLAIPATLASLHARDALALPARPRPPSTARAAGPTLLLLTVDTLRADAAGPTFRALADRGLSGPAWSTAPWTLPALASLHTGRTPYDHGALVRAPVGGRTRVAGISSSAPTLAESLSAAGWRTGAFVENPQISRARGFARGFGTWDSPDDRDPPRSLLLDPLGIDLAGEPLVRHGRDPEARVDRSLAWLAEDDGPAFLWVHLLGPHLPYFDADLSPGTALGDALGPGNATRLNLDFLRRGSLRWTPALHAEVRAAYANEAARADAALARLVAAAGPDAVVVYTADHGEELGEHGGWEHGHALWEEIVRVPLAMAGPGIPIGAFAGPASLVDVAPTLLNLTGAPASGIDLRAVPPDRTLMLADTLYFEEREGLVRWPWKLTRTLSGDDARLVDLAADPSERVDVSAANPDVLTTLSLALDVERARLGDTPVGTIDEKLRALGYVE
jgi:arylsulfatase A-like enzyme